MNDGLAIPSGCSAQNRFEQVMTEVRGRISKRQFSTWFGRAFLRTWDETTLVVGLPNRFYQVWFQNKFSELVREAAERVAHAPVTVTFEVTENPETTEASAGKDETEAPAMLAHRPPPAAHSPVATVNKTSFRGSGNEDLPLRLNPLYSFDNFIVGPSNSVAHASAKAVAQNPGRAYNPLFVHGSVGLGKTHLLHAVCHEFLRRFPQDRVCFLS